MKYLILDRTYYIWRTTRVAGPVKFFFQINYNRLTSKLKEKTLNYNRNPSEGQESWVLASRYWNLIICSPIFRTNLSCSRDSTRSKLSLTLQYNYVTFEPYIILSRSRIQRQPFLEPIIVKTSTCGLLSKRSPQFSRLQLNKTLYMARHNETFNITEEKFIVFPQEFKYHVDYWVQYYLW